MTYYNFSFALTFSYIKPRLPKFLNDINNSDLLCSIQKCN